MTNAIKLPEGATAHANHTRVDLVLPPVDFVAPQTSGQTEGMHINTLPDIADTGAHKPRHKK